MLNRRDLLNSALVGMTALSGTRVLLSEDQPATDDRPTYRAKQILGSKVTIQGDASVGTVDDIVLDEAGNVDYLIVINTEKKYFTIPWDAAQFDPEKRLATVHITEENFKQVPVYTSEQYPRFSTPTYRNQTYQRFGLTPGQQRRIIRRALRD